MVISTDMYKIGEKILFRVSLQLEPMATTIWLAILISAGSASVLSELRMACSSCCFWAFWGVHLDCDTLLVQFYKTDMFLTCIDISLSWQVRGSDIAILQWDHDAMPWSTWNCVSLCYCICLSVTVLNLPCRGMLGVVVPWQSNGALTRCHGQLGIVCHSCITTAWRWQFIWLLFTLFSLCCVHSVSVRWSHFRAFTRRPLTCPQSSAILQLGWLKSWQAYVLVMVWNHQSVVDSYSLLRVVRWTDQKGKKMSGWGSLEAKKFRNYVALFFCLCLPWADMIQ